MNIYEIPETHLISMLKQAAELGARRALIGAGQAEPTVSWSEACRIYGQGAMLYWKKAGLIEPIQQGHGATKKYCVTHLVALALSENRSQYLSAAERRRK